MSTSLGSFGVREKTRCLKGVAQEQQATFESVTVILSVQMITIDIIVIVIKLQVYFIDCFWKNTVSINKYRQYF